MDSLNELLDKVEELADKLKNDIDADKLDGELTDLGKALEKDLDAANNLIFAKRLTLDRIEELPKSIFQKFNQNYLQKLSYNQWAFATVILGFLASFLFLMFYFSENSSKKRGYFVTSILGFLLFFASIFTTYNQFSVSKNTVYAIVFSEKTEVKNGPTPTSEEVFTLHEGAKVAVLDSVDNWKKIKLADGKIGWLISNEIKIL
jgi:hypothetical protein